MKRGCSALAALLVGVPTIILILGSGHARASLQGEPLRSADDSTFRDSRFFHIRDLIASGLDQRNIPSVSIAVAHKGHVIWQQAFGWADREKHIKASPDTVYSLASTTKPMTATGLLILVSKGKVDLDAPVERYVGSGQLTIYEGSAKDVTVRRLLHHTA